MKILTLIMGILLTVGQLHAYIENAFMGFGNESITALYIISTPREIIGGGRAISFVHEKDGQMHISQCEYDNSIHMSFGCDEYWHLSFSSPNREPLKPGVYKNAQRHPFQKDGHPGLSFSGSGRGHNTLDGEFQILELEYDEVGNIERFAANFIQTLKTPLCGSIRYNSRVPVQKGFLIESFEPIDSEIQENELQGQ